MTAKQAESPHRKQIESGPGLSLVIPAYNEESRIAATLTQVDRYLSSQPWSWEVILVDDGSSDRTAEIARFFADTHPNFSVLSIRHAGKANAVLHGMTKAKGGLILFSDADLATPLSHIDEFLRHADNGADVVIGSREGVGASRIGEPFHRHYMGRVFNGLVRGLLLPGIHDTQCGFKLVSRDARDVLLPNLLLYPTNGTGVNGARVTAFDVELLLVANRQGLRLVSVPVTWSYGQQSKVNPVSDTLHNLQDVLRVKMNDLRGRYRN